MDRVTYPSGKEKFAWQLACLRAMNHASLYSARKSLNQLLTNSLGIYTVTIVQVYGERSLNAVHAVNSLSGP